MRSAIDMITKFCGSPNVDARKIIQFEEDNVDYRIPLHEFTKHALLGEFSYFNPHSSTVAVNLFDILQHDEREHFLASLMLAYCDFSGPHRDKDHFVQTAHIVSELQSHGFTPGQIEWHIRRLASRNLIEAVERISLQAEQELEGLALSKRYRLTSVGKYHLRNWACTFSYLDAVSVDTPLFDKDLFERLGETLRDFDIKGRFERAVAFKSYLSTRWLAAALNIPYFDFSAAMAAGDENFKQVANFISKRGQRSKP